WQLQVCKSHDGMPGCTTSGITGTKAYQETSNYHHHQPGWSQQIVPVKYFNRYHSLEIADAIILQFIDQCWIYFHWFRVLEKVCYNYSSEKNARDKKQVPDFLFPIVLKKGNTCRNAGCANMAQGRRDTQRFI